MWEKLPPLWWGSLPPRAGGGPRNAPRHRLLPQDAHARESSALGDVTVLSNVDRLADRLSSHQEHRCVGHLANRPKKPKRGIWGLAGDAILLLFPSFSRSMRLLPLHFWWREKNGGSFFRAKMRKCQQVTRSLLLKSRNDHPSTQP